MKHTFLGILTLGFVSFAHAEKTTLQEVASFPTQQVTGVTVSKTGWVFVNFPFWSDDHTISVAEIVDGNAKPFPSEAWQRKAGGAANALGVRAEHGSE